MRRRGLLGALAAAVVLPRPRAQGAPPAGLRRIAALNPNRSASPLSQPYAAMFLRKLAQAGWAPGSNLLVNIAYAEGHLSRLPALAQALIAQAPDLVLAIGNDAARAVQAVTRRVPTVLMFAAEPVDAGLVGSLARPGGNTTGTTWLPADLAGKGLELLHEAVPGLRRVAGLGNSAIAGLARYREAYERSAAALGVHTLRFELAEPDDVTAALARIAAENVQALYVNPDLVTEARTEEIAAFALRRRLPCLAISRTLVDAGALLHYGPDVEEMFDRTASFIDRILRGALPSDLPMEQPTRYESIVNLRTARALGLSLPRSLLLRITRVIE